MNYNIFKMTEKQLLDHLPKELSSRGYGKSKLISTKDYVYAIGDIPIMLVSHLDTVHKESPKQIFHDTNKNVLWSPEGIGADDRAGVLAILKIASVSKKKPYILFTTKEEIGGIGANIASREIKSPKVNLLIELDRRGSTDAVFYDCDNPEFTSYITSFGFKEEYGSFSDISTLCPTWGIAGVNLSCGYYNAHSLNEYLNLNELNATIEKVLKMMENLPKTKFQYVERRYDNYKWFDTWNKYNSKKQGKNKGKGKSKFLSYGVDYDDGYGYHCSCCGDDLTEGKHGEIIVHYGVYGEMYCDECFQRNMFQCEICGEPKYNNQESMFSNVCETCAKKCVDI